MHACQETKNSTPIYKIHRRNHLQHIATQVQEVAKNLKAIQKYGGDRSITHATSLEEPYTPQLVERSVAPRRKRSTKDAITYPQPPSYPSVSTEQTIRKTCMEPIPLKGCRCISPQHESFMRQFGRHSCACFVPAAPTRPLPMPQGQVHLIPQKPRETNPQRPARRADTTQCQDAHSYNFTRRITRSNEQLFPAGQHLRRIAAMQSFLQVLSPEQQAQAKKIITQ